MKIWLEVQLGRVKVDLFQFILWLIACLLFVKLVKLDFAYVAHTELDWRYVEMLTKKRKKRELLMCTCDKFVLLFTSLKYLS